MEAVANMTDVWAGADTVEFGYGALSSWDKWYSVKFSILVCKNAAPNLG